MNIIGFSGLAGSGKDTAADYLINTYGDCFRKLSFGDAVKDIAAVAFGWDRKLLQGDTTESRAFREAKDEFWSKVLQKDFTPRLALQYVGTDLFRNIIDPAFWIFVVQHKIETENYDGTYLITDVRFPNETDMIHSLSGKVYRIVRGDLPEWYSLAEKYNRKEKLSKKECELVEKIHPSERAIAGLNKEDEYIHNDGTLEEYQKTIDFKFCPTALKINTETVEQEKIMNEISEKLELTLTNGYKISF